jgi:hypothetical protein
MATYNRDGTNTFVAGESNARAATAVYASSLTPASHARDGVAFTLHALGKGFSVGAAVINFDGVDQATTVVSDGDVSASLTLPAGSQARSAPVVVKAGNGFSTPLPFAVT